MKIELSQLAQFASNLASAFDQNKISKTSDLEMRIGARIPVVGSNDSVEIDWVPSNNGTYSYVASYVSPGVGVPIEIGLNNQLRCGSVVIKAQHRIADYRPFKWDRYLNLLQEKTFEPADLEIAKQYIRMLSLLGNNPSES